MRQFGLVAVFVLALSSGPAAAYENFIPLGHGYSPEETGVPDFASEKAQIVQQSDIFETEIYHQERETRVQDSYIQRFISNQETTGADYSIDY
jgi:hypothetical protein